jgi:hypothetical protein
MEPLEIDPIARRLQERYGLTVMAVSLDRHSGEQHVVIDVTSIGSDGAVNQCARLACPAELIGLPRHLDEQNVCNEEFHLPQYIGHALKDALTQGGSEETPLWLRMTPPVGLLPIVPWETLLEPLIGRPVLRLPYHEISPTLPTRGFDCVVCFSSPVAKRELSVDEILSRFLVQVPADLESRTAIHVFADAEAQPELKAMLHRYSEFNIRIYDPAESERNRRPGGNSPITNPWLLWIRDALGRRSADVVHFLCHSYLSGEEGALALAESPTKNNDPQRTRFVWADELVAFLNTTGAWSTAFTSPPENHSMTGLRMLQDAIARCRPGPCLLHDMAASQNTDALGDAYRFLYLPEWHHAPSSRGIALYCHPRRQSVHHRVDETSESLLQEVTLEGQVGVGGLGGANAAWLSTAQRVLEQSATQLTTPPANDEDQAFVSGRKAALRFVSETLAQHSSEAAASADVGVESPSPQAAVPNATED